MDKKHYLTENLNSQHDLMLGTSATALCKSARVCHNSVCEFHNDGLLTWLVPVIAGVNEQTTFEKSLVKSLYMGGAISCVYVCMCVFVCICACVCVVCVCVCVCVIVYFFINRLLSARGCYRGNHGKVMIQNHQL